MVDNLKLTCLQTLQPNLSCIAYGACNQIGCQMAQVTTGTTYININKQTIHRLVNVKHCRNTATAIRRTPHHHSSDQSAANSGCHLAVCTQHGSPGCRHHIHQQAYHLKRLPLLTCMPLLFETRSNTLPISSMLRMAVYIHTSAHINGSHCIRQSGSLLHNEC